MFWRKSNQIKALKSELEIKDRILADRVMVLAGRNEEIVQLHKARDAMLDERVVLIKDINEGKQKYLDARAERDAFAKRVEELEAQAALPKPPEEIKHFDPVLDKAVEVPTGTRGATAFES